MTRILITHDDNMNFELFHQAITEAKDKIGENFKAVYFDHRLKPLNSKHTFLSYYRDYMPPHLEIEAFSKGYEITDKILENLPEIHHNTIKTFYHEIARIFIQASTFNTILGTDPDTRCLIVNSLENLPAYSRFFDEIVSLRQNELECRATEGLYPPTSSGTRIAPTLFNGDCTYTSPSPIAGLSSVITDPDVWRGQIQSSLPHVLFVVPSADTGPQIIAAQQIIKSLQEKNIPLIVTLDEGNSLQQIKDIETRAYKMPQFISPQVDENLQDEINDLATHLIDSDRIFPHKEDESTFLMGLEVLITRFLNGFVTGKKQRIGFYNHISSCVPVSHVFTINEGYPGATAAAIWARSNGISSSSYLPFLISDHPENRFFPSGSHLVYGSQSRNLLIKNGCNPDSVESVGWTFLDHVSKLDRSSHQKIISDLLPNWNKRQKLFVLGTEARPGQVEDLKFIVEKLQQYQDQIYTVVKIHPNDNIEVIREGLQHQRLPNITFIDQCDVMALIDIADCLICERSNLIMVAAVFETLPLVIDFSAYYASTNENIHKVGYRMSDKGHFCKTLDEVVRGNIPPWKDTLREQLEPYNTYSDGLTSKRVATRISESVAKSVNVSTQKPEASYKDYCKIDDKTLRITKTLLDSLVPHPGKCIYEGQSFEYEFFTLIMMGHDTTILTESCPPPLNNCSEGNYYLPGLAPFRLTSRFKAPRESFDFIFLANLNRDNELREKTIRRRPQILSQESINLISFLKNDGLFIFYGRAGCEVDKNRKFQNSIRSQLAINSLELCSLHALKIATGIFLAVAKKCQPEIAEVRYFYPQAEDSSAMRVL